MESVTSRFDFNFDFDLDEVQRFEPGYDMLNRKVFILDKKLALERRLDPDGPLGSGNQVDW